ncbi:hypothetical protein J4714_13815 [Staphylococcus epidermidis]|nr:hypothetical protein [Staphylococcus epidermidis]
MLAGLIGALSAGALFKLLRVGTSDTDWVAALP